MQFSRRVSCRLLLSLSIAVAGALSAFAQPVCFGPDGLDGSTTTCCTPANVNLPAFPIIQSQQSKYMCFLNCNTQLNANVCATIGPPAPAQAGGALVCGIYTIRFTFRTCGGAATVLWSGTMRAQYSRTWVVSTVPGTVPDVQVWRFLLNGDLVPSTSLPTGNPSVFAPCMPAFGNKMHVWGYIDYAGTCIASGPTFSVAWALNHGCDSSAHGATSTRPGAFHASRSYTWVGPSAGFVIDPVNTTFSNGTAAPNQDSIRKNRWTAIPSICSFREPLQISSVIPQGALCPCGAGGTQYDRSIFRVVGQCGTNVSAGFAFPIPFIQKRIGRWTSATAYPGLQELVLDEGYVSYQDGCTATTLTQYLQGVETIGGFLPFRAAQPPLVPLDRQFEDLATANIGPNNSALRIGSPYVTHYIINVNYP
ncbi:MAG: hypothetical protein HY292_05990 [Planctomycetes bacterium]|nr:hypothetical protein [Planctomycetota bacterium]